MESEKLTVKDFVYISTLSDLGGIYDKHHSTMLKLDISPGDYGFLEFHDGYLLAKYGYYPDFKDMIKIFNNRDGDKGLSGTYHDGDTEDETHMRLFNDCFRWYLHEDYAKDLYYEYRCDSDDYDDYDDDNYDDDDYDDDDYYDDDNRIWPGYEGWSDSEGSESGMENDAPTPPRLRRVLAGPKKLTQLGSYHNLPVLFYLNQCVNHDDLSQLTLKLPFNKRIGNVQKVWRVVHDVYGDIGVAVLQEKLFNIMGDQAGLAFFSTTTAQAFGNFNINKIYDENLFIDEWVTYPRYLFHCKFNPCNCDWYYSKFNQYNYERRIKQ